MSYTQVYINGLSRFVDPSDEELEAQLDARYSLSSANADVVQWAGPGTSLIKRDEAGSCRGYAFIMFYSEVGASMIVDKINDGGTELHAELSDPKAKQKKKRDKGGGNSDRLPDIRLRRPRKAPIRKHPVIVSSDRTKTNMGNKNR